MTREVPRGSEEPHPQTEFLELFSRSLLKSQAVLVYGRQLRKAGGTSKPVLFRADEEAGGEVYRNTLGRKRPSSDELCRSPQGQLWDDDTVHLSGPTGRPGWCVTPRGASGLVAQDQEVTSAV